MNKLKADITSVQIESILNIMTMPISYTLKDHVKIEAKVTLLRVVPNGKRQTLDQVYAKLRDLSWISGTVPACLQRSYTVRAQRTLDKIIETINDSAALPGADAIVSDAAEYIVSVVAEDAIVNELHYRHVPLPEVFKHQSSQNPGFDYLVINANDVLLFGEAKFVASTNAYGRALKQIVNFIASENDIADLADIYVLVDPNIIEKADKGQKGFSAAFSSTNIATKTLVKNIQSNKEYSIAQKHDELVLVAVDML
jgi:hypothetical protein